MVSKALTKYILVAVFLQFICINASYAGNLLSVKAEVKVIHDHPRVEFVVKNISDNPIVIYNADLPWATRNSALIVAVTKNGRDILPSSLLIDDPGPGTTTIKPNETLIGSIFLERFVNGYSAAIKNDDIIIFWFYEPKDTEHNTLGNYGGWLELSK
jgi:hypothetical protein